jgi:uncharacterized protein
MQLSPEDHINGLTRMISKVASVKRIVLFGSRARGYALPRSDIDLGVDVQSDQDWWALQEAAEEYPTLFKIDLVRLGPSNDDMTREILSTGKVLYERN